MSGKGTRYESGQAAFSRFTPPNSIKYLWLGLGLPEPALDRITFTGEGPGLPSSFKIGHIAQAAIGVSALAAGLIHAHRNGHDVRRTPQVTLPLRHACAEYKAERLYTVEGKKPQSPSGIGGLHKTSDGFVRIHDAFPNHVAATLRLFDLSATATREDVAEKALQWKSLDLENAAFENGTIIAALRSYEQWDALPQACAVADFPIQITKLDTTAPPGLPPRMGPGATQCLQGLRVIEFSRVIAAPLAGKTLAAHGADVLWVTAPHLPDLPYLDIEFSRGKRSVHLDLCNETDVEQLRELVKGADVFLQGYRPGSLAAKGFAPADLIALNPSIICANLSAYGDEGPWSGNRGFDSLVQTCSGMNVSEAEHFGNGEPARVMPCQALDHTAGFFLATGVMAALYKRATDGSSYAVNVSLAGCAKYLRSLGQYEGKSGFACDDLVGAGQVEDLMEERKSSNGVIRSVRHSAQLDGVKAGAERMPVPKGCDDPVWL